MRDVLIDREDFRPIISGIYDNRGSQSGYPNVDEVVIVKLLKNQQWYGFSDPELERHVANRLSFQRFLDYPESLRSTRRSGSSGSASPS